MKTLHLNKVQRTGSQDFYLYALQLFDQRPAAYEALVEQGQDGRTFQDCLPESSPRTYRGQMDISAVTGVFVKVLNTFSHLSRTGHLMLPIAEWNAPVYFLLQLAQRPLRMTGRTPGKERTKKWSPVLNSAVCWINNGCLPSWMGRR